MCTDEIEVLGSSFASNLLDGFSTRIQLEFVPYPPQRRQSGSLGGRLLNHRSRIWEIARAAMAIVVEPSTMPRKPSRAVDPPDS